MKYRLAYVVRKGRREDLISELKTHFAHDSSCFFMILKDGH